MSWIVCTIGRASSSNWALCKEVGAYGIPGKHRPARASEGDRLLVWLGGKGFIAEAVISGAPRVPTSKAEVPWPGGMYQYGFVVPFELELEVRNAVTLPFVGQVQDRTGISKSQLHRSFSPISSAAGELVHELLVERAESEPAASER